jgi:ABC-type multidrug transport system permease subunit
MTRGYQRLMGDKLFFFVTVGSNLVISLLLGSVFFDLPDDASSINSRCVLIYFAILFNGLNSALEILSLYAQRPIVEKHARYALYRPLAEAVSSTICDLPSKILSTLAFNLPLYFMAGLRHEVDAVFTFLLFGFTCTLSMSMLLRTIGQSSKTVHQALTPAAILILGLVIYTGFILPTRDMQGWLRWINYANPIAYAYESLVVNEFTHRQFSCLQFVPAYPDASPDNRACAVPGAAPGADFIDGDFYIGANYGYTRAHLWRNFGILCAFIVIYSITYVLAAEYIKTNRSKGEVLVFGRKTVAAQDAPKTEVKRETQVREKNERSAVVPLMNNVFHWQDVCYEVSVKGETRRILDHVDGWVKPGTLTALMVIIFVLRRRRKLISIPGIDWSRQDHPSRRPCKPRHHRRRHWRHARQRNPARPLLPAQDGLRPAAGHSSANRHRPRGPALQRRASTACCRVKGREACLC